MDELKKILRYDRQELLQEFQKASLTGKGTPDHVATAREAALHNFLGRYFPNPHHVSKGIISDSYGCRSASIDAIIVNPIHPHTMLSRPLPFFLAAEGIDYAIELKPRLDSKQEIERGLQQIRSVKKLRRRTDGLLLGRKQLSKPLQELALQIPCILFSEKTYDDKEKLISTIVSYYRNNEIPAKEQFDIICILDGTFVVNSSNSMHFNLNVDGLVFCDLGEDVLYYFLHFLLKIPPSTPKLKTDVLSHYIDTPPTQGWKTYHNLNTQLRASP